MDKQAQSNTFLKISHYQSDAKCDFKREKEDNCLSSDGIL
jgi:hypothetical protein